jgi:hypothetical protein
MHRYLDEEEVECFVLVAFLKFADKSRFFLLLLSSNWFFTCFVKGFDVVPNEERKKAERKWGRREKKGGGTGEAVCRRRESER